MKNKVEDQSRIAKSSLNNKNRVSKPVCNENVKQSVLNANSELICVKCKQCMFDANHDLCFLHFVSDMNVHSKSKSAKSSTKRKMWKPTGKMLTEIGYKWKPTGWFFTIDGNKCPLTRITSTSAMPPKKHIPTPVVKTCNPESSNSGIPQDKTKAGSVSKSKKVTPKISNTSEPMQNWGSKVSATPSSSNVRFRSSKLSYGTWTRAARST